MAKKKFKFTTLPLQEIETKVRSDELSGSFEACLSRNLTDPFKVEIILRKRLGMNLITSVYGKTGSGKSFNATTFAEWVMSVFGGDLFYCFSKMEMLKLLNELAIEIEKLVDSGQDRESVLKQVRKGIYIMDEQKKSQRFGAGAMRESAQMEDIEMIVRELQLNFIFLSPVIEVHVHHYVIETYDRDYKNNYNRAIILSADGLRLGVLLVRHPDKQLMKAKKYGKKKMQNILDTLRGRSKRGMELVRISKELVKDDEYLSLKNKSERKTYIIDKYGQKTGTELGNIMARVSRTDEYKEYQELRKIR